MHNQELLNLLRFKEINDIHQLLKKEKITKENVLELLKILENTSDVNIRNKTALLLSDIKCDQAADVLIRLINQPTLNNKRGTLLFALQSLDVSNKQLIQLLPLLYTGNYEVRQEIINLFEKNYKNLENQDIVRCLIILQKQITECDMILSSMEELKEDLINNLQDS